MPEVLPEQQPFSGELGFKYSENLSPEMKRMVRVLTNVSELGSSVDKTAELDKFEKQAFGVRNQLWDEKTDISREFAKILKADETIGDDQRNNIRTGIDNFSGYLRSGDLRRASDQQETVRRQLSQVTDDGERRGLELLSGALELVEAKWRFGRDRELMGQLEVLSREKILDSIDGNLDLVRDATKITRKRDEAGDRADVKGKERHTREIWYTEALKTGFSGRLPPLSR